MMYKYLRPTKIIDSNSPLIRRKAEEILSGSYSKKDLAIKIFYFVRDRIKYYVLAEYFNLKSYKASETLKRGWGYCVQKAILLVALARATDIPARICFADIINHSLPEHIYDLLKTNVFVYHGYAEIFLKNKWIKLTPIFDRETLNKMKIGDMKFNGEDDVMLPSYNEEGERLFEYIGGRGCYSDLPYKDLVDEFRKIYKFL